MGRLGYLALQSGGLGPAGAAGKSLDGAGLARGRRGSARGPLEHRAHAKPARAARVVSAAGGRGGLCLAAAGGQQAPILAAAGAQVTVLDASPAQLAQDRRVAEREGLAIRTVQGDMADLSQFGNGSFDLIVHPVSNCFVPQIQPVWNEAFRVLKAGGTLLSGFTNPAMFMLDPELQKQGVLQLKYPIPYSDLVSLTPEELQPYLESGEALVFGHSLSDQIGGQIAAGFAITGFFEDTDEHSQLRGFLDGYIATKASKP